VPAGRRLARPQARDDHSDIVAGTTARDRVALRGRPSYAEGTRFVHDRTAAEEALALANQVSIDRAAQKLGVSKQALRRAFDHHGLPQPRVFQGGPRRTRFYEDRQAAEQAWRRRPRSASTRPARSWGSPTPRAADRLAAARPGPATPPHQRRQDRHAAAGRGVPAAEPQAAAGPGALGPGVGRPRPTAEYATLGAKVVVELHTESHAAKPSTRAWAITRRAQRAHRRASGRQQRDQRHRADRASRTDRTSRARALVQERQVTADAR
jgi:hypothetical protein